MKLPKSQRPVARVFGGGGMGSAGPFVVTLDPKGQVISIRLRGERTQHPLPVQWLYRHAAGLTKGSLGL